MDTEEGTVYTGATGALPVMSLERKQYYCLAYEYANNCIHALPVADFKDEMVVVSMKEFFKFIEDKGHKPQLNVMDNQVYQVAYLLKQ